VIYGVVGLKTHTKTTLVVRQEPDGIRCYVHIGTGNYNGQTARVYTDVGLFNCDPDITSDIVELFHHLTGQSVKRDYRKLLVVLAAIGSASAKAADSSDKTTTATESSNASMITRHKA
jgi:polyphosphate kinase